METANETFTPVQAFRRKARHYGHDAKVALTGLTGLSTEAQFQRLKQAEAAYEAALEQINEAMKVVESRGDGTEYQATKHQGLDGWADHVSMAHGVPLAEVGTLQDVDGNETADEAAYFLHQQFEAHEHAETPVLGDAVSYSQASAEEQAEDAQRNMEA